MFTGIIQNLGVVKAKREHRGQARLTFQFSRKEKRAVQLGESIAVNGVCLTVSENKPNGFSADLIRETLESTNLGALKIGQKINLERSLLYGDSMGGHFVTGHVDGVAVIQKIEKRGKNFSYYFKAPQSTLPYLAQKGSVALDGISLTIQTLRGNLFSVGLVPHTLKETTLGTKKAGSAVNLEVDLVARYLRRLDQWVKPMAQKNLNISKLKKQGF